MIEFHKVKDVKIIVIITYYYDLFESFPLGRVLNHQLLTTYYRDIDVAVCVKEFHHAKGIKLIVIITYYSDLFECFPLGRLSFHQPKTIYCNDIHISLFIKKIHKY